MKIEFLNLGVLKKGEFTLGDFTIICGENNTGKTYATYATYGFFLLWKNLMQLRLSNTLIHKLIENGSVTIDLEKNLLKPEGLLLNTYKRYTTSLPDIFATRNEHFTETEFKITQIDEMLELTQLCNKEIDANFEDIITINKPADSHRMTVTLSYETKKTPPMPILLFIENAIKEVIFGHIFPRPFIASAERTGISIFLKEIDFSRTKLFSKYREPSIFINQSMLSRNYYFDYPRPLLDNMDFIRLISNDLRKNSFILNEHPEIINYFQEILGGKYTVNNNSIIYFTPKGSKLKLRLDESSSSVRSLVIIGLYIKHVAKPGDIFMVDEPELNLHPENQRKIARLFAMLVNAGVKVYITTHSDYIIKEINTLIMLNRKKPHLKRIAKKEGYHESELLSVEKVRMYTAETVAEKPEGAKRKVKFLTLTEARITQEYGIEAENFDKTIIEMNQIQDEIIWGEDEIMSEKDARITGSEEECQAI